MPIADFGENGTLYIGVTSDLLGRIYQHKEELTRGFTSRHKFKDLLWYEPHDSAESAIIREKRIKKWRRKWRTNLIEGANPYWRDLYAEVLEFKNW